MVELTTLGTLDLRDPAGAAVDSVLSQPKRLAVLLYLALETPGGLTRRDTLLALFWPDSDAARARNSLSKTLSVLRKALGEDVVVTRGNEEVGLDPGRIRCDAVAFDEAIDASRLEDALELYQGDLAPGFHADASVEFEQWLEAERKRHRQAALAAARELSGRAREAGRLRAAVKWARRAHSIAPLSERAVGDLVEALAAVGDRTAALDVFDTFVDRLAAEYVLEPSPELVERVQAIADGSVPPTAGQFQPATDDTAGPDRPGSGAAPAVAPEPATGAGSGGRADSDPRAGSEPEASTTSRRRGTVLAALGILIVAAAGYFGLRAAGIGPAGTLLSHGTVERSDQILIADFASPGDELLGATAAALLRTDFSMSNLLEIPDEREIAEAMARMRAEGSQPDSALALELAVREGYELVVLGEIAPIGRGYVVTARLVASEGGEVLGRFRAEAEGPDDFVDAVDAIGADIFRSIGESRTRIRQLPPLSDVTTSSLDALKAYTEGQRLHELEGRFEDATPYFRRATQLDSTFGAAYYMEAVALANLGRDPERRSELWDLAYLYRDRMTPRQRLRTRTRNLPLESRENWADLHRKQVQLVEEYARLHPGDLEAQIDLADGYNRLGRYEESVALGERLVSGGVDNMITRVNLFEARLGLGDIEGAERELRATARAHGTENPLYARMAASLALCKGDIRGAYERAEDSWNRAVLAAALGRLDEALRSLGEGIEAARVRGDTFIVVLGGLGQAWLTAEEGLDAEARERLAAQRARWPPDAIAGWQIDDYYALTYGLTGDTVRLKQHLENMSHPFQTVWATSAAAHSMLALQRERPAEAIRALKDGDRVAPGNLKKPLMPFLGEAYIAAGMPDSAVSTYERFLSTPGLAGAWGFPTWVPSLPHVHRELARLYEARKDTAAAIEHYGRFIELWRDTDPELQPRVEAVRTRLRALRSGDLESVSERGGT